MVKFHFKRTVACAAVGAAAVLSVQAQDLATLPASGAQVDARAGQSAARDIATRQVAIATKAYWTAKAQCWADLSKAEASQGDTRGTAATAQKNADQIRSALTRDVEPGPDAEHSIFSREILPAGEGRYGRPTWRADLATVDAVMGKYRERFCRTPITACLEVARQSVYENLEETQGARWNHGRPELDKALALATEAGSQYDAVCGAQDALNAVLVPQAQGLDGVNVAQSPALAVVEVPADMLFKFDQASVDGMLAGGRGEITRVAAKIKSYSASAGSVEVVGHTDRLGEPEHNQALSQERASTVARLLEGAGVGLPVKALGAGASAPVTGDACKPDQPQHALVDCLQPDRRVTVRIMPATAAVSSK